jgi:hypothetical protein
MTSYHAKFYSRSHDAVIPIYDDGGNVIETHEHAGDFTEPQSVDRCRDVRQQSRLCAMTQNFVALRCDLDRIRPNIRNDSETSLATWQWRAKVP